jgi:HAD superfamily hydrolase (TIGR01509 family)
MTTDLLQGIKCVLLDIDGTLVDSNEFHVQAWEQAFQRHGHAMKAKAIRKQIGKGGDQLIPALLPGLDAATSEAIAAAHDEIFQSRYLGRVKAFRHAHDLVARLHERGLKIVLASSAKRADVDHYIELLELAPLLAASTCSDDVARSKPKGDLFAAALSTLQPLAPEQALAIGDTPYDVIAAARCGIKTLALLSGGFAESELQSAGAAAIHANVGAVLDAIGPG